MAGIETTTRPESVTGARLRRTPGAKAGEATVRGQKTARFDRKLVGILRTAATVFAEVGFDAASIRLVAERADVSVAGLYHYVRSKDELLYLIQYHVFDTLVRRFEQDSERMLAAGGAEARPEARLERFIRNHLEFVLADMASLTVCTRELGRLEGEYLRRVEGLQRTYFTQAHEIFKELARDGDGVGPRTAALAMFGTINWVSTWYDPEHDGSAAGLTEEFTRLYLGGVTRGADRPGEPTTKTRARPTAASGESRTRDRGAP
jgi:AcrR family transcriptional regulator